MKIVWTGLFSHHVKNFTTVLGLKNGKNATHCAAYTMLVCCSFHAAVMLSFFPRPTTTYYVLRTPMLQQPRLGGMNKTRHAVHFQPKREIVSLINIIEKKKKKQ